VRATKKPGFLDIPLSHVEKDYHPQKIVVEVEPDFSVGKETYVAPYQWFTTRNFIAFDENRQAVDLPLRHSNHRFIYEPAGYKEFTPEEFTFSCMVKRDDRYSSINDYNMHIGVLNQTGAKDFASTIIAIFGDASYRGVSPANVKVNGRDTNPESLLVKDTENLDWIIIQSKDGVQTKDGSIAELDYETIMKNGCNVWVTLSDEGMAAFMDKSKDAYTIKAEDLGVNELGGKTEYSFFADYGYVIKENVNYDENLNTGALSVILDGNGKSAPMAILEKPDRGYIVISHEKIFSERNIKTYAPLIYNILVSCFLNGYTRTRTQYLWITNDVVDYIGSTNTPLRRKHPAVNIRKEVDSKIENFRIVEYSIDKADVMLDMIDKNGEVYFSKLLITDPPRQNGDISVYTTQGTVMLHKQTQYSLIEDEVHLLTEINDENCYVTVEPFVSSSNRLVLSKPKRMKIEYIDMTYDVYALPIGVDGESEVMLIERSKWQTMGAAVRIASVHVEFVGEPAAYDIRQLGGGLPAEYTDYEMMDVGHIKGRPYRVGVSAVIELPKNYREYDARIKESVDRYKVAADQIYVTYKN